MIELTGINSNYIEIVGSQQLLVIQLFQFLYKKVVDKLFKNKNISSKIFLFWNKLERLAVWSKNQNKCELYFYQAKQ